MIRARTLRRDIRWRCRGHPVSCSPAAVLALEMGQAVADGDVVHRHEVLGDAVVRSEVDVRRVAREILSAWPVEGAHMLRSACGIAASVADATKCSPAGYRCLERTDC